MSYGRAALLERPLLLWRQRLAEIAFGGEIMVPREASVATAYGMKYENSMGAGYV